MKSSKPAKPVKPVEAAKSNQDQTTIMETTSQQPHIKP
jgi:hypothetical protein